MAEKPSRANGTTSNIKDSPRILFYGPNPRSRIACCSLSASPERFRAISHLSLLLCLPFTAEVTVPFVVFHGSRSDMPC
ncbi:hypothetical protein M378DRAFT_167421 [Amanita muscaria Koide BX008]|uniref:Uncharacterized protein n=1 Tax=Amanita muscaria (strain Koide BX008) TaxID=946122 RepID=A0A0C2WHW6_AMAMK|nr:hypothetical protein M378DRAFT_167421 [Amanita muscaria Koide BX008]